MKLNLHYDLVSGRYKTLYGFDRIVRSLAYAVIALSLSLGFDQKGALGCGPPLQGVFGALSPEPRAGESESPTP